MDLRTHLLMERCRLQREIDELIKKREHLPEGQIHFDRNGKYWKWRRSFEDPQPGHRILSKSEDALARDLVKKRHLSDRLELLQRQIDMIDRFLLDYPNAQALFDPSREPCPDYWKLLSTRYMSGSRRSTDGFTSLTNHARTTRNRRSMKRSPVYLSTLNQKF